MNINERIRYLRKQLNLTMEKFGERLGVTKITISRLERGERNVTEQMLKSICREFHVNEDWLRNGEGGNESMFASSPDKELTNLIRELLPENHPLYHIIKRILITYQKLNEKEKKVIENFILELFCEQTQTNPISSKDAESATMEESISGTYSSIEEEVESYRKELEAREKTKNRLSASPIINATEGEKAVNQ